MAINYVESGDHLIQVGRIVPAAERDHTDRPQPPPGADPGQNTNVRAGNATVGEQTDVVTGPIIVGQRP